MILTVQESETFIILFIFGLVVSSLIVDCLKRSSKELQLISFVVVTFLLVLLSSVRFGIGTDYFQYMSDFFQRTSKDFLFEILTILSRIIYDDFFTLIFFSSLLTHSIISYIYFKKSKLYFLSIFLYLSLWYFFGSWNLIRQYLAMAFVFLFIVFLLDKKFKQSIIYALIATLFHSSAFTVILITLVIYLGNNKVFILILSLFLSIFIFYDDLIALIEYTSDIKHLHYLFIDEKFNFTPFIFSLGSIIPLMFFIIKKNFSFNDNLKMYLKLYSIGVVFLLLSTQNLFFSRLAFYFLILQTLLVPNFIEQLRSSSIKFLLVLYYLIYGTLSMIFSINQYRDGVIPLKFIF